MNDLRRITVPVRSVNMALYRVETGDGQYVAYIHEDIIEGTWVIDGPPDVLRAGQNVFLYEEELVDTLWARWLESERSE